MYVVQIETYARKCIVTTEQKNLVAGEFMIESFYGQCLRQIIPWNFCITSCDTTRTQHCPIVGASNRVIHGDTKVTRTALRTTLHFALKRASNLFTRPHAPTSRADYKLVRLCCIATTQPPLAPDRGGVGQPRTAALQTNNVARLPIRSHSRQNADHGAKGKFVMAKLFRLNYPSTVQG